jgi:hypothetical protein
MGWTKWVQLVGVLGGAATVGLVVRQLIGFVKFVLKRRTLNRVIDKNSSSPERWIAAAKALQKIDSRPHRDEPGATPAEAEGRKPPPQLPQRSEAQERAPTPPPGEDRPPPEHPDAG